MSPSRDRPWINWIGLALLAVCYAGALYNVFRIRKTETEHNVIRIVHWQLELGVREGLNQLIREFEDYKAAQGQPVRVIQIPMPERTYKQYVTTRLIGANAPDMIQIGKFPDEYLGRYFLPVSKVIQSPNPFVAREYTNLLQQTDRTPQDERLLEACRRLQDRSWMDTFSDGLRTMFKDQFQEYYGVGFSQFTIRMFYNRRMFQTILGSEQPPASYRDLLAVCAKIRDYAEANHLRLDPIASSQYQMVYFKDKYHSALTRDIAFDQDINLDGNFPGEEKLVAMLSGHTGVRDPQYRAGLELGKNLAEFFPRGFMALGRMDAAFSFVQGRAAMITSGSWDARSFMKKIQDQPPDRRFDVGIFDLPMVDPDDPEYGRYVDGRETEAGTGTGFAFGITRFTKHHDLCIEFLQFCTTPRNNTVLNDKAAWIPAIDGAQMSPLLERFRPNFVGLWGGMNVRFVARGACETLEDQVYWPYISGEIDYDTYAHNLMRDLPREAAQDFKRLCRSREESIPGQRSKRSVFLAAAVLGPEDQRDANERKLLRSCGVQAVLERGLRDIDIMVRHARDMPPGPQADPDFNRVFFETIGEWYQPLE